MADDRHEKAHRMMELLDEHPEWKEIVHLWFAQDTIMEMRQLLRGMSPQTKQEKETLGKLRRKAYHVETHLLAVVDPTSERAGLPPIKRSMDQAD